MMELFQVDELEAQLLAFQKITLNESALEFGLGLEEVRFRAAVLEEMCPATIDLGVPLDSVKNTDGYQWDIKTLVNEVAQPCQHLIPACRLGQVIYKFKIVLSIMS